MVALIKMFHRQEERFSKKLRTCADRIISIFQPHVRPIVRGKAKAKVEFGAKIGLGAVAGFSFVDHISRPSYNEASDLKRQIDLYKERYGYYPKEIEADKIYLNKENRKILEDLHIVCHCTPLGRPPKNADPEKEIARGKASASRDEVEGSFETAKRVYRANNIRAKLEDTSESWIASCYFAKNIKKFLSVLLCVLIRIFSF